MDFFKLIFDHFIEVIIFLFLFGGSIGALLRWFVRSSFEHRERMQEKRNEELRLRLELERARKEQPGMKTQAESSGPLPKDISWDDHVQTPYEQGYQQQQIHQR